MMKLLNKINSPADLKAISPSELPELISEIRTFLIETVNEHGGHLASNLGVVELTVALHRIFDSPRDRIIFDVGHQSYVHKLLTGRRDMFGDLRVPGGLSGFTKRSESEHDHFGAGHSSTSVSAALGFAEADRLNGEDRYTVAVIGDGAYTGGMVHEALNNCKPDLPMIIVLNENGMSISTNKGTFARYIARVRISSSYQRWKSGTNNAVLKIPKVGKAIRNSLSFFKERIKSLIYDRNYFEELGLYYIGPIDGNNYKEVSRALEQAKRLHKTVVVHVKTVKGKGYSPAEQSPDGYHSVSVGSGNHTFSSEFARIITDKAREDGRIVAVTAAMGIGTGLSEFEKSYPDRCFDVGIAEEHAVTFSAALAAAGKKPFAAIYSTFLQRGYDNIIHDVALQSLPVALMIDRAGLSLSDGATHHGIFDVAYLSHMPNMTIYAPASYKTLAKAIDHAVTADSPIAIRYPNATEDKLLLEGFRHFDDFISLNFDPASPPERIFITYGKILSRVKLAEDITRSAHHSVGIILLERLKPYRATVEALLPLLNKARAVLYVEEGILNGGAAQITLSELIAEGFDTSKTRFAISAIDDTFGVPDRICDLYGHLGLSPEKIAEKMLSL